MALQPVDLSTPENVFTVAATDFRAGLSEDQRNTFHLFDDPCEMIRDLEEHIKRHSEGKRSRLLTACSQIESFRKAIEPYFQIVDILVSSHPEWAAIVWGAVRLVFSLSQHYVSFFEKLADMLGKITAWLPLYGKHMIILKRHAFAIANSVDEAAKWRETLLCLSKSLAYVYADILKFCNDARNFFSGKKPRYLFERELEYVYNEDTLSQHAKIDREIQKNSLHRKEMDDEKKAKQSDILSNKIRDLKHWIAASDWAKAHDEAEQRRLDESGTWFIGQGNYQSWARSSSGQAGSETPSPRLLIITGKPGYGKTILCSQIIEDLQNSVAAGSSSWSASAGLVAYFYFTNLQNASSPTIRRLFLKRLGPLFLVFDGLDECSDTEDFFLSINDVLLESSCKILILTRPIMDIPGSIDQQNFHHIVLENESNSGDIEIYLRMRMGKLIERTAIAGDLSLDVIIAQLCRRTNSMFLWAVLMSNYLSSPYLTPNERLDAIYQLNRFEGLDAMYARILEGMSKRMPEKQQSKVTRIFQWLAVAKRPLSAEALRTGLAVQQDRPATSFDFIQSFESVLSQMCGSLVEVRKDRTVDFIHVSVLDYLTQRDEGSHGVLKPFHIEISHSEASMTGLCLSYLTYEVPNGPLASSSAFTPQRDVVETRLPLLNYVSEWWPWHAGRSFMLIQQSDSCRLLHSAITAINVFIHKKPLVTAWIEALFLFRQEHKLTTLVSNVTLFCGRLLLSSAREALQLVDALKRFSIQIGNLYQRWHKVLISQPNEIWGPSIQAWSQCEFLVGENLATITTLNSDHDIDWILISSHVSLDSSEVGLLKVLPPAPSQSMHQFRKFWPPPRHAKGSQYGWKATYEIWSLETLKTTSKNDFLIPREQIDLEPQGFRLPVAFSPSLRTIVVVDTIFRVTDEPSEAQSSQTDLQILPASGCQHNRKTMIVQRNRRKNSLHARHSVPEHTCYGRFYYIFSPNSQYLAALEGDNLGISGSWILTLFEEPFPSISKPAFTLIASIRLEFSPFILLGCHQGAETVRKGNLVCFHPFEPVVAFCPDNTVMIWQFTIEGSKPLEVHSTSLLNLGFSSCGEYLHGKKDGDRALVVLNVASKIRGPQKLTTTESPMAQAYGGTEKQRGNASVAVGQRLIDSNPNTTINSQQSTLSMSQGQAQVISLEQDHNTGSIILKGQNGDRSSLQSSLARIPASVTLQNSFPTLAKSKDQDSIRLVLNQAPQMSYSFSSTPDVRLPLVFDRPKDTISIERMALPYQIERVGKRTIEDDNDDEHDDDRNTDTRKAKYIRNI